MFEEVITSPGGIVALFVIMAIMDAIAVALSMTFTKKL